MPIYAFLCEDCDEHFDEHLKLAEYDTPQKCPSCDSGHTRRRVTVPRFNLPGDGWASKNGRIRAQMRKKHARLDALSEVRRREAPVATLRPNVGGEQVDSWSEAKRLAGSQGKNTSSYDPHIRKEKDDAKR